MAVIADTSVQGLFDSLAGASATPGGGSVTALMGAMGAALVAMVCNLTLGKDAAGAEEMQAALGRAQALRRRLISLVDEDVRAFEAVMGAYALPRASDQERAQRSRMIQAALQAATLVPLECARACGEVLELSRIASERGHGNALGEAGVAALAAHAALRGAAMNVYLNTHSIRDRSFVEGRLGELEQIMSRVAGTEAAVCELVQSRLK